LTLEPGGVNGNSSLPRDPEFYRRLEPVELPEPRPVGRTFWWSALWAALHALACTLFGWRYPHYRHHRDVNAFRQAALWARAGLRKLRRRWRDRAVTRALEGELAGRYFFVPLQVQGDHQLVHAPFHSIAEFIEALVTSFARHAPRDALLVLKHHPMDRAYTDYTELVRRLCRQHAVEDRVWYVDAVHLPTCLKHARGTVVMNSTVGLSSLYHQTPTKCLGTAVYDIPGLTHQGPLDRFWTAPGAVDEELRTRFVWWVRTRTQLNGTVWTGLLDADPARPDEAARPAPHSSPAESG